MKKYFFSLLMIVFSVDLYSNILINEDSIKSYREALILFDNQDYGKALNKCEDAIKFRKEKVKNEINILNISLSARVVQNAGDNLQSILKILERRGEFQPINIIMKYLKFMGEDYFENSISKVMAYIEDQEEFPEVQKLIGDIYKLEGEYEFAEQYYLLALDNKSVLDIPNDKYEILYMLADISEIQKDYERMEIRYLNIIAEDKKYNDKALENAMINTISNDKKDSFEKFFQLYRSDSYFSLKAYYKLGEYYNNIGDKEKALKLMSLATITGFTKIINTIEKRNINYEYSNFESALFQVQYYEDIVKWADDNDVWSSINLFADICKNCGYKNFSINLLKALSQYSPVEFWRKEAVMQLSRF